MQIYKKIRNNLKYSFYQILKSKKNGIFAKCKSRKKTSGVYRKNN
jgi:hypothetical protein